MSSVTWFVDRYIHIATPDRQVVREMACRCRDPHGRWKGTKAQRKAIYREALTAHRANRSLYRAVVGGRI